MIKKLQKLKAKKGFTLVELIVVIAIIGVLAAILVPTMLGYVQNSRVTAADQVAKTIKDAAQTVCTEMDTLGMGLADPASPVYVTGNVTKSGNSVTVTVDTLPGALTFKGLNAGSAGSKFQEKLKTTLETLLTEAKTGTFRIGLDSGTCIAAYWSEDTSLSSSASLDSTGTPAWVPTTPGVLNDGSIVGSAPKYTGA